MRQLRMQSLAESARDHPPRERGMAGEKGTPPRQRSVAGTRRSSVACVVRRGRKATGLNNQTAGLPNQETAELPNQGWFGFLFTEDTEK